MIKQADVMEGWAMALLNDNESQALANRDLSTRVPLYDGHTLLELAMLHRMKAFVAHPYSQALLIVSSAIVSTHYSQAAPPPLPARRDPTARQPRRLRQHLL